MTHTTAHKIATLISTFLMKHGGMNNGYETRVDGTVRQDTAGTLKIWTPRCDGLTHRELNALGAELNEGIRKIMGGDNIRRDLELIISSTHIEHGRYKLIMEFVTKFSINLF